ncbi:hypothetical protein ACJ3XI_02220 [Litorimonas sp. RW-G-Af-16]|uniref:hypothetical protein n=1 Tax=Litorimonas sp. RW-G-Af-16 TaxID=3241168 RepID=UPI00390CC30C
MTPKFAGRWIRLAGLGLIAFGFVQFTGALDGQMPGRFLADLFDWPLDGLPTAPSKEARFMTSLAGSLTAAIGVLFLGLIGPLIEAGDRAARGVALVSLLMWVSMDITGSIAVGQLSNIVFCILFFILLASPLIFVKFQTR